ncbi:uncharacterized protein [Oscarella lobularis]|uniref:uncharacterized protein isoform X2 n=1 Tax=Oscarella lobularis TaxID=121494 RepID=UPI0033142A39
MSQPCTVPGFLFEGFGYVLLSPGQFIGGEEFKIKLFFRTTNPDGMLFAAFKSDALSYVYLALIDGELEFGVQADGNNSQSIRTEGKWNKDRFYRVEAMKTVTKVILRVYYGSQGLLAYNETKCDSKTVVVVDNSYVGGLPVNASRLLPDSIGFIGCIRVMFFYSSKAQFNSSKIQKLVNVVQENDGCPPSVEKAMHFRGSGYVRLNLSSSARINDELHFRFRVRTSWPNGLLLAAFGNVSKNFLFVETRGRDGIDVRYRTNKERVNVIRVNRCILCDGSWHEIDLSITDRFIIVRVDNEDISPIINVTEFSSEILQNVYFGGLPQYDLSETKPTPVEVALGVGVNVTGYGGCLANFSVNEILIDVVKKRAGSANLIDINSASENGRAVTDTNVEAFTEYLYRVVVKVSGGGVVYSEWTNVRTGSDSSSSGRFQPEIDYDGMNATIQWVGPPTVLKDDESYDIDIYAYTCTVCLQPTISTCYHWKKENAALPYLHSPVAASTMYTVNISASVFNRAKRLMSNFSTPVVTRKSEANSNVGEYKNECDYNEKEHSSCFSFNTSWCPTKPEAIQRILELSSNFCSRKTASSSYNISLICQPPPSTVSPTTENSLSSTTTPTETSSSPVQDDAYTTENSSTTTPTETSSSPVQDDAYTTENSSTTTPTETSTSPVQDYANLVGTGIGCAFAIVLAALLFFFWKKKRKSATSFNRNVVQMTAVCSSSSGENMILSTFNECYSLPQLPPPPLPPPNQRVCYNETDCIKKRTDTPLDAVNPEDEHVYHLLRQTGPNVTTASISVFWEPAKTEAALRNQLARAKVPLLKRSDIYLGMILDSGQFKTIEKGIWTRDEGSSVVVAVKTLKSEKGENRVKFLREAAIINQFKHNNVIKMYGVVLSANPMMIVVEMLPKGDLKQFLSATRCDKTALESNLAASFLQMSRGIADGMAYLAGSSFIHRDLAARNVLLDENLVCKIADFALARDFNEENYYMGQISIRWTAPEVLKFFKYSLASDLWSYGVVLYEIWSLGERPYDCLSNKMVVENVEMGYRLPAPPGCPYAIYELMIECWHPDYHKRPSFSVISTRLSEPDDALLINKETSESISGEIGDCLEDSCQPAYLDLQYVYQSQ